jgi:thioredoxin reductase
MPQQLLVSDFILKTVSDNVQVFSETVTTVDLSRRPFTIHTDEKSVEAESIILATGAVAKRMVFKGSGEGEGGFWNKGISACAVRHICLVQTRFC